LAHVEVAATGPNITAEGPPIYVAVRHDNTVEMIAAVAPGSLLKQLLDSFSAKTGMPSKDLCLKYQSEALCLDRSISHYNIQDGDVLQCSPLPEGDFITVLIKEAQPGTHQFRAKIKRKQTLKKLFQTYATRAGKPVSALTFLYNGKSLTANATPKSEKILDGGVLVVESQA